MAARLIESEHRVAAVDLRVGGAGLRVAAADRWHDPQEGPLSQVGYDRLLALTDSRYRLSTIVGRRAAQLKGGIPTTLDPDEMPEARLNTVTLAMKEFELGREVRFGEDLPTADELRRTVQDERRREEPTFTVSRPTFDDDDDI